MSKVLLIIVITLLYSCTSEEMKLNCEDLSQGCFRGYPRMCNALEKKCKTTKIRYTKDVCQNAFNKLLLTGSLKYVKSLYGIKVEGCFNKDDIKKFQN